MAKKVNKYTGSKKSDHATTSLFFLSKGNKTTLIKNKEPKYRVEMDKTTMNKRGQTKSRRHFFEANSMTKVERKLATYLEKDKKSNNLLMKWDYDIYEY